MPRFLHALGKTRDIHKLVGQLEQDLGAENFVVQVPMVEKSLFFLQDPTLVRKVLHANTSLGFVNRNFDLSHRHFRTINAVNTTDSLWQDLHEELTDIFNTSSISPLMEKYRGILLEYPEFNLNATVEEYLLKVWSEYSFGQIDVAQYQRVRLQWVKVLGKAFHSNQLNRLPLIGDLTSRLQYRRNQSEIDSVDLSVSKFLESAIQQKQGAFYQLYERLKPKYGEREAFLIARDNSLLGLLVYDFIHGVVLDYVANNAKTNAPHWRERLAKSEAQAFLYPWRFRVAEEDFGGAKKGDYFVINLVRARAPFSAGPRVCAGARLFGEVMKGVTEILSTVGLEFVNPEEEILYNGNLDIPLMTSSHQIKRSKCPF